MDDKTREMSRLELEAARFRARQRRTVYAALNEAAVIRTLQEHRATLPGGVADHTKDATRDDES